jgi:hypothetical protein
MKRYLLFILFAAVTFVANAQKSYLFVRADVAENTLYTIRLSGDIPASMSKKYSYKEIGEILNEISSNGFDMDYCFGGTSINMIFSKGDSNQSNAIQKIEADNDDVREIARYNLQGIPVKEGEKGLQIIVYSNYTTKTIVVQ